MTEKVEFIVTVVSAGWVNNGRNGGCVVLDEQTGQELTFWSTGTMNSRIADLRPGYRCLMTVETVKGWDFPLVIETKSVEMQWPHPLYTPKPRSDAQDMLNLMASMRNGPDEDGEEFSFEAEEFTCRACGVELTEDDLIEEDGLAFCPACGKQPF